MGRLVSGFPGWVGSAVREATRLAPNPQIPKQRPDDPQQRPWIVEEDLPTAGSIILVQDTDIMFPGNQYYPGGYEVCGGNWQFIFNLCTTFRR
jgi:hypothetical protein